MNEIVGYVTQYANMGIAYLQSTTVLIVTIALGVIVGVFGLKLSRIWAGLVGFILGLGVGSGIVFAASLTGIKALGVLLGAAVVLAVLFCIFYKIGMFFYLIFITMGVVALVSGGTSFIITAIGAVVGIILGVLAVKWFDPIVIIVTAGNGAVQAGSSIVSLLALGSFLPAKLGIPAVLFVVFMLIQFFMRSKQVGKQQVKQAKEHKAKTSRENEVERARNILDLDDLEDEYEDDEFCEDDDSEYYDEEDDDFEYYDEEDDDEYIEDELFDDDEFEEYEDDLEEDEDFTIL